MPTRATYTRATHARFIGRYALNAAFLGVGATALLATTAAQAEMIEEAIATEEHTLSLERVAEGLAHPWALAFLPDGGYLVSERGGRLLSIDAEGTVTPIEGLFEVSTEGQGGLLDLALHPQFGEGEHDWLYLTWSKPEADGSRAALSRLRWDEGEITEVEHLFEQDRASQPGRHYGSRLAFLPDGTLLMSVGDRGSEPARAQDRGDHAGSILRLTDTGGVPDDNPFVDDPDALDEIYTLGNRNVQGMTVRHDGTAWITQHGPLGGDELNPLTPGANYGWPKVSQGNDYATNEPIGVRSLDGMEEAAYVFEGRFAPSGLAEVSESASSLDAWHGDLLAGGLASEQLVRLRPEGGNITHTEVILNGDIGRVRDVRQGPDGAIYLLTDAAEGALYRLAAAD